MFCFAFELFPISNPLELTIVEASSNMAKEYTVEEGNSKPPLDIHSWRTPYDRRSQLLTLLLLPPSSTLSSRKAHLTTELLGHPLRKCLRRNRLPTGPPRWLQDHPQARRQGRHRRIRPHPPTRHHRGEPQAGSQAGQGQPGQPGKGKLTCDQRCRLSTHITRGRNKQEQQQQQQ